MKIIGFIQLSLCVAFFIVPAYIALHFIIKFW
jgi:hypothetical protein